MVSFLYEVSEVDMKNPNISHAIDHAANRDRIKFAARLIFDDFRFSVASSLNIFLLFVYYIVFPYYHK